MLSINTISEALTELQSLTAHQWSESELFDFVVRNGIELHAAAPPTAKPIIYEFVIGEGMVTRMRLPAGHSPLAVLFPWQVAHLWITGETQTGHPRDHEQGENKYKWYEEPFRVTRDRVRVRAETLKQIAKRWNQLAERIANRTASALPSVAPIEDVSEPWKRLAPSYADNAVAEWALSRRPTKKEIATKVAARFKKEGIIGKQCELDAAYVLRHGLNNWKVKRR